MSRQALSLTGSLLATLRRELQLAISSPGKVVNPLMFFIISISLFPLSGRLDIDVLGSIAPGIIWVCFGDRSCERRYRTAGRLRQAP